MLITNASLINLPSQLQTVLISTIVCTVAQMITVLSAYITGITLTVFVRQISHSSAMYKTVKHVLIHKLASLVLIIMLQILLAHAFPFVEFKTVNSVIQQLLVEPALQLSSLLKVIQLVCVPVIWISLMAAVLVQMVQLILQHKENVYHA